MYCKNCGKQLPDNARFCDKCNMSVRKKEGKMDIIEELKEERLARQKAHEIEARLKKIKKVKRKRYKAVALIILGVIVVWGVIVGVSFYSNWKNSTLKDAEPETQSSATPVVTEAPDKDLDDGEHITITLDGMEITYPSIFSQSEVEESDCVASFSTEDGSAKLIIDRRPATQTADELMNEYYKSVLNAKVDDSSATDEGYIITISAGTKKYHKKCVIKKGEAVSFEMIYPKDSAEMYEEHIQHMDKSFTVS